MAATRIKSNPLPLANTSESKQNHLPPNTYSANTSAHDRGQDSSRVRSGMSISMSQGSQPGGLMMQPGGPFRQYDSSGAMNRRDMAPQIYSVRYR